MKEEERGISHLSLSSQSSPTKQSIKSVLLLCIQRLSVCSAVEPSRSGVLSHFGHHSEGLALVCTTLGAISGGSEVGADTLDLVESLVDCDSIAVANDLVYLHLLVSAIFTTLVFCRLSLMDSKLELFNISSWGNSELGKLSLHLKASKNSLRRQDKRACLWHSCGSCSLAIAFRVFNLLSFLLITIFL